MAIGVIAWSMLADCIGRVKAMSISVTVTTAFGGLVPFINYSWLGALSKGWSSTA
jgi:hypothetical protein